MFGHARRRREARDFADASQFVRLMTLRARSAERILVTAEVLSEWERTYGDRPVDLSEAERLLGRVLVRMGDRDDQARGRQTPARQSEREAQQ